MAPTNNAKSEIISIAIERNGEDYQVQPKTKKVKKPKDLYTTILKLV